MNKNGLRALTLALLGFSCLAWNYSAAGKNREGNELYKKGDYAGALKKYSEALTEAPEKTELYFNIADSLYKQSKFDDAAKLYEKSAAGGDLDLRSKVFYNKGNVKFKQSAGAKDAQSLREAVALYKQSLDIRPGDGDAKYNLELALREIKKREEEKKEEKQEQNKEQEQKDQKEKKEREKKEKEQKDKQQEKQEQKKEEKKEQERKQEQPAPRPAEKKEQPAKELSEKEAGELIKAFEREQRDPTKFIETQIEPEKKEVEKDW